MTPQIINMEAHGGMAPTRASRWLGLAWRSGWLLLLLILSGCNRFTATDLPQYVVSDPWHGSSPFVDAKLVDGELRRDWNLYGDPVLNWLNGRGGRRRCRGKFGRSRFHDRSSTQSDLAP